jgi:hypothetical protein
MAKMFAIAEIIGGILMSLKNAGVILLTFAVLYWVTSAGFDPDKHVCVEVSKTLYTNVGTPIIGQDGKPIPCTPK